MREAALEVVVRAAILLVDSDSYTASVLSAALSGLGYETAHASSAAELAERLTSGRFDAAVLNFHYDQPASLACCSTLRQLSPETAVVVVTSPGPALREVLRWRERTGTIDAVVEKPLVDARLYDLLGELAANRRDRSRVNDQNRRLARLVPVEALGEAGVQSPRLEEMAILFTDVRQSTQLASRIGPAELFDTLNKVLSRQARVVREHGGSVLKYTGDGLMASFRGLGRVPAAARCALKIQAEAAADHPIASGVGLSDGLVMTGLVGERARQQYDVIGATVHMAARFCSLAEPGEVVTTARAARAARIASVQPRNLGHVAVRGFDEGIECVAYAPGSARGQRSPQ